MASATSLPVRSPATSSSFLPPPHLRDLKLGDSIQPLQFMPSMTITKVAHNPPIFIFRGAMSTKKDRDALVRASQKAGMQHAETEGGNITTRIGSHSASISQEGTDPGNAVSQFMTQLNSELFVSKGDFKFEHVAIVRYDKGGKFDMHYDELGRIVTVIHYLNGVGGTWFPLCQIKEEAVCEDMPPDMAMSDYRKLAGDKTPGKDGLLIVGAKNSTLKESANIISVRPGDAIAFYNYEYDKGGAVIRNSRALHAGMPADKEKWIATNFYRVYNDADFQLKTPN